MLSIMSEEVATAIGISLSGIDIGNVAGFNIPAYYLNEKEHLPEELWREFVKSHLMLIFLVCLSLFSFNNEVNI